MTSFQFPVILAKLKHKDIIIVSQQFPDGLPDALSDLGAVLLNKKADDNDEKKFFVISSTMTSSSAPLIFFPHTYYIKLFD